MLQHQEVDANIFKAVCTLHSDHIEGLVDRRCSLQDIDVLLWQRLSLEAGKINEQWFEMYEDKLVKGGWPRCQRFFLAALKRPDVYPGVQRKLQEIKNRTRPLIFIHEENRGGGRGRRGGPYSR